MIGADHQDAKVTNCGHDVMAKLLNKTQDLVWSAIVDKFKPLSARTKRRTFENGKEFAGHAHIDE
jgi:IS30 family transposase